MIFNHVVRTKLDERKLKVIELAKLSGISYAYLIDLLRNRRRWNIDTMQAVCQVLNMEIEFKDLPPSHAPTGTD